MSATRLEMIVGYLSPVLARGTAATALVDQFNSNREGFELISQGAQTSASVASIVSITAITPGFIPFVSITANVFAGTLTFLKITAEVKEGKPIQSGDAFALIGNVAGVVAGVFILGGISTGAVVVGGLAIMAGVGSLIQSDAAKNLYKMVVQPLFDRYFQDKSESDYPNHWVSPDLQLVGRH